MPLSLEEAYNSIKKGFIPEEIFGYQWNYPLGSWISIFKKCTEYINDWIKTGEVKTYWLRAFIYPKGFLTALLLSFSQKLEEGIENLTLNFQITPYEDINDVETDLNVVYLSGIYMINGKYNNKTDELEEFTNEESNNFKSDIHYSSVPLVSVIVENDQKEDQDEFDCPVYYLTMRTEKIGNLDNHLMDIKCPTCRKYPYWIKKNLYMTCINPELNA